MLGEFADRPLPPDGRGCDHVDYHHGHVIVATGPQRRFDQCVGGGLRIVVGGRDGGETFLVHFGMQAVRADDETSEGIRCVVIGCDAVRRSDALRDDVARDVSQRLLGQHLPGVDGVLALRMIAGDAGKRARIPTAVFGSAHMVGA